VAFSNLDEKKFQGIIGFSLGWIGLVRVRNIADRSYSDSPCASIQLFIFPGAEE